MSTEHKSETPRTDLEARKGAYLKDGDYASTCGHQFVHIDFARQLERELNEAKSDRNEYARRWRDGIAVNEKFRVRVGELEKDGIDSPTWPHVLVFAKRMEAKLKANRHKGDRDGWIRMDVRLLGKMLQDEVDEMFDAFNSGAAEETANECADVANFAMMIADWFNTHAPAQCQAIDEAMKGEK